MKTVTLCLLLVSLVAFTLPGCQSDTTLLPGSVCIATSLLYRTKNCFSNPSQFICKVLRGKLNVKVWGVQLCDEFVCDGGRRQGFACTSMFGCRPSKITTKGLCPLGKFCCNKN